MMKNRKLPTKANIVKKALRHHNRCINMCHKCDVYESVQKKNTLTIISESILKYFLLYLCSNTF